MAPAPNGPWTTCMSVPQEIYTIPPSSPVYNVTYVTQTANADGTVQASYTAGYLGTFILGAAAGAILADRERLLVAAILLWKLLLSLPGNILWRLLRRLRLSLSNPLL